MADDSVRVTIEMGDGYQPTERFRAAVRELDAALAEAHGDEVSGFELEQIAFTFQSTYQKIEWTWAHAKPLQRSFGEVGIVSPRDPQSGLPTG